MYKLKGYIFSREFQGERVPQAIQNMTIRNYCTKNNFYFLLSTTEYSMRDSNLMLFKTLNELEEIDGIVAYSMFQMPNHNDMRIKIYNGLLSKKKELHFALENMVLKKKEDIEIIENLWKIKSIISHCYQGDNNEKS